MQDPVYDHSIPNASKHVPGIPDEAAVSRVEEQHPAGDDGAGAFDAAAVRFHAVDGLEFLVGVEGPQDRCRPALE